MNHDTFELNYCSTELKLCFLLIIVIWSMIPESAGSQQQFVCLASEG